MLSKRPGKRWRTTGAVFSSKQTTFCAKPKKTLQNCGQKQQDFGTKLDQELQTLEQEIGKNSGFVASLSAGGILAKQELVAQKESVCCRVLNRSRKA